MSPSTTIPATESESSFRVLKPLGTGPSIRLDRAALNQLEVHIRAGVKAINNHGVEVGGLILGEALDWNAAEVAVTGFIPLDIEYRFGPAFRPSDSDIAIFQQAAAGANGTVIGYFRSQLRDGAPIRIEDTRLLAELFPTSDCCLMTVHATTKTPSRVDLYQVRAGSTPVLSEIFALKENAVVAPAPPVEDGSAERRPKQVTQDVDPVFAEASSFLTPKASHPKGWLWIVVYALACLFVSVLGYRFGHSVITLAFHRAIPPVKAQAAKPKGSVSGDSSIGLQLVQRGSYFEIRWNPANPALATATLGKLIIALDRRNENIVLEGNQLRSGLYLYKDSGNLIMVLLMICQPDGSFTGDTKEFKGSQVSEKVPAEPAVPQRKPAPTHPVQAKLPQPKPSAKEPSAVLASPYRAPMVEQAPVVTAIPSTVLEQTRVPAVLEPPQLAGIATVTAPLPVTLPAAPRPAAPMAGPIDSSAPKRLLAPRLIRQAVPAVPVGVATRIRTEVQLEVNVTVDADGKVTGAHIVSSQGAGAGLLAIEVLKAAQLSRFMPALQDGQPVSGSMLLTFRFAPASN